MFTFVLIAHRGHEVRGRLEAGFALTSLPRAHWATQLGRRNPADEGCRRDPPPRRASEPWQPPPPAARVPFRAKEVSWTLTVLLPSRVKTSRERIKAIAPARIQSNTSRCHRAEGGVQNSFLAVFPRLQSLPPPPSTPLPSLPLPGLL